MKTRISSWEKNALVVVLSATGLVVGLRTVIAATEEFNVTTAYEAPGTRVVYAEAISGGGYSVGLFENSWYLSAGVKPKFDDGSNGWKQIGATVWVTNLNDAQGTVTTPMWQSSATYTGASVVTFNNACYKAKWWNQGNSPATAASPWEALGACPADATVPNPWNLANRQSVPVATQADATSTKRVLDTATATTLKETIKVTTNNVATNTSNNGSPAWNTSEVYLAGSVVYHSYGGAGNCYKAKWWTSGNEPKRVSDLVNLWDSPWEQLGGCPSDTSAKGLPANLNTNINGTLSADVASKAAAQAPAPVLAVTTNSAADKAAAEKAATDAAAKQTSSTLTIAIPPVIAKSVPRATPVASVPTSGLPAEGYAFLRLVTVDDWNWLFPLRSGKANSAGGTRNNPPFASTDGSKDSFTLSAFIRAVLEYNTWAKANGYKQFLNEGTLKQQAEEFLVFWAKSSRETSGSWSTAKEPWIEKAIFGTEAMDVWKGGLYWVEEVGYTTDATTGKSAAIGYVDTGSTDFPPSVGRSYYGRGVIQLSWNYNYGAFSYWMYDNGLFKTAKDAAGLCVIDRRNKLLDFPNLVADCGDLSILSGIWFWMTPQGAKPSSHDVLFGDVTHVSKSTNEQGLPQTNNNYEPKVVKGETNDPEVFAYRLGTIINIVNGGLECNKSAKWHGGPLQRVSYYNAYAAQFNQKYKVNATRVPAATNVWATTVQDNSDKVLQSATCYNQKSYYGW